MSKMLQEQKNAMFQDGEFVICPCSNATFLPCKPLPGDMTKCPCGNDYSRAKNAQVMLFAEYESKEQEANEGAKKNKEAKEKKAWSDLINVDRAPHGVALAVHKTFKNTVAPAFEDPDAKANWNEDVLGENPYEAMLCFNAYYMEFENADKKTKHLDAFRRESTSAGIVSKLVAKMNELTADS